MRGRILAGLALCVSLAACGSSVEQAAQSRNINSGAKAVDLAGNESRCIPASKLGMYAPSTELVGDLRTRFLTPQASLARVRVFVAGTEVTGYGSTTVIYTNEMADCILWAEGLPLQEFAQRAGLNPLGISPHYLPDTPKPTPPAPAPAPAATPTPAAGQ